MFEFVKKWFSKSPLADSNEHNKLVEICKEYDFDIEKPQQTERDETLVEVQFHGITRIMPRWKAFEFAGKLHELGFNAIINGVFV